MRSEKLEETILWREYEKKCCHDSSRCEWVKKVYEASVIYLKDVRQTFKNYTLHDETHVLNVLDAMGGLLGDMVDKLTTGELELLLLAASMHDLGMVYTDDERKSCFENESCCKKFLRENCPELLGFVPEEWPEDIRQWYLRTLHPFRITDVLQNDVWRELFEAIPKNTVPKRCILAVCQSHGQEPKELLHNENLEHLQASDASPLFCAILLRLADLLDFDDTRSPRVLYSYVACNEESRKEWDKHQASAGFRYPSSPSVNALPYKARCTNPGVEHAVRDFLDWVDDELGNSMRLQKRCEASWQQEFPFPREVLREEIESDGYMSGDFCLTMNQEQILKMLSGENLYDNHDVFVRELLQNAIDATLLRGEMDQNFKPEESRIDIWEWSDKEGNIWFRVDDEGTGMTLGMLSRYFLKVGNSYYTSKELQRDLREHGQANNYQGISRFGIGFLSCFLCGDYAEVSTLYFDSDKNRREESISEDYGAMNYGLRLQVTGLTGYYTLKNQVRQHVADSPLPAPDAYTSTGIDGKLEYKGYRNKSGTSVVLRLNPGKLGALDLKKTTQKYLCGAKVPVYYNNKRVGQTYKELMEETHNLAGEKIYELTDNLKKEFDTCFPALCGQYPKIIVNVVPLDTEENQPLPELSGVLVKYKIHFDKRPKWRVGGCDFSIMTELSNKDSNLQIIFFSMGFNAIWSSWEDIIEKFGIEKVKLLEAALEKQREYPPTEEQLGEVWTPFQEYGDIEEVWKAYQDNKQEARMCFSLTECKCPELESLIIGLKCGETIGVYQGVRAGTLHYSYDESEERGSVLILLEGEGRPKMEISRSQISGFPLKTHVAIAGILSKYGMRTFHYLGVHHIEKENTKMPLKDWRTVRTSHLDNWMKNNLNEYFSKRKEELQNSVEKKDRRKLSFMGEDRDEMLDKYLMAELQDSWQMTIDYEGGQVISFVKKKEKWEDTFDLFPPMMFCKAGSNQSRQYICSADCNLRRGITADHPYVEWLLENAAKLNQYYHRQFEQIVECFCSENAEDIIEECNAVREQLLALPENHGVDVSAIPMLREADFWSLTDRLAESS